MLTSYSNAVNFLLNSSFDHLAILAYMATVTQRYVSFATASKWAKSTYEKALVENNIVGLGKTIGVSLSALPLAVQNSLLDYSQKSNSPHTSSPLEWRYLKEYSDPSVLKEIQKDLIDIPYLGDLISDLLIAPLSPEEFGLQSAPFIGVVKPVSFDTFLYSFYLSPNQYPFPDTLGGEATPNEVQRLLQIQVSYASWRDSRTKRLLGVRVSAQERWPERTDKPIKASTVESI